MKKKKKKGVALIMAMWIMTILVMVAASFAFMMRTEIKMATNFRNEIQAHYLARAGVEYAIAKLRADTVTSGDNYEKIDTLDEDWYTGGATGYTNIPLGKGTYTVTVKDEAGKMNLNALRSEHWHELLGGTSTAAQQAVNIIDYQDGDEDRTPYGPASEDGFEDYADDIDKDAPFDTIRELVKVDAIGAVTVNDYSVYITVCSEDYNTKVDRSPRTNINTPTTMETLRDDLGITEDQALAIIGGRTYTDQHWIYELSIVSPIIDIQAKVDEIKIVTGTSPIKGTININTALQPILEAFGFDSTDAPAIINYRDNTKKFDTRGEILAVPGIDPTDFGPEAHKPFSDLLTVRSDRFRIVSEGFIPDATNPIAKRKIEVVVDRQFRDDGTMGSIKILYWSEHMD